MENSTVLNPQISLNFPGWQKQTPPTAEGVVFPHLEIMLTRIDDSQRDTNSLPDLTSLKELGRLDDKHHHESLWAPTDKDQTELLFPNALVLCKTQDCGAT